MKNKKYIDKIRYIINKKYKIGNLVFLYNL